MGRHAQLRASEYLNARDLFRSPPKVKLTIPILLGNKNLPSTRLEGKSGVLD
jgi:hypothetical protein